MGIYKYAFYKSPNIGIFVKCNDQLIVLPLGFAPTKTTMLSQYLEVTDNIYVSIADTRLLGPMMVMNNNGILVSYITSDEEINILKEKSQLNVERLKSKYTAIGNLIATNDHGAIVSPLCDDVKTQIQDILGVSVISMRISGYIQTGALIVATNKGAAAYPNASDDEIKTISDILNVNVEPITINGGIPFLASGIIANSKSVVVGNMTSGPELIMLSRAFNV
ncbi:MAG TPA: translation initiation factor IF-6 [Nitrososphaeraceae archaeon]|nr:translation initiation factor IF-6 [Nitrososphaeraceae archaeon]